MVNTGTILAGRIRLLFAAWIAAAMASALAAEPHRIVSINLCTDQLLLMLAEPGQIASVTYLAAKPAVSPLASVAKRLALNYGQAEEVLMFKPDLVLASVFTLHSTNTLLRKFGIRVLEIPVEKQVEDIRENIKRVALAIGNPDKGAQLLEKFDQAMTDANVSPAPPRAVAALYRENNVLYGANSIAGTFTQAAGMENLADRLGFGAFSDLPLEILIEQQPDIIIQGTASLRAPRGIRAYRNLHHPALAKLLETRLLVRIPDRLWACGSPLIVEAIRMLTAEHLTWRSQQLSRRHVDDSR